MITTQSVKLFVATQINSTLRIRFSTKPTSSEVLTAYLMQCKEPPWTSYFVKVVSAEQYSSIKDDQFGMSNFNWKVGSSNYQILRTGCFPYIKYHCSKKKKENLGTSDKFMRVIKVINLDCCIKLLSTSPHDLRKLNTYVSLVQGIPCLLYGLAATQLIRHKETVVTTKGPVTIYFLLPEDKGSIY